MPPAYAGGVSSEPLAQRLFRTVGESPLAERLADAQQKFYGPLLAPAVRSPLHTAVLGHSVHPPLTDVTLGCWLSATILDVVGGPASESSARLLVAAGLLAAAPTAVSGAADWVGLSGSDRRVGAVHALGTDLASLLFLGSLVARVRGHPARATTYALAGNAVMASAGLLGGHLALQRGTARRDAPVVG